MDRLDECYIRLLGCGLTILREAAYENNLSWVKAEVEFLHNIPSLIGEGNVKRHEYFWMQERSHYLSWLESHGPDKARSMIRALYLPVLNDMEAIVTARIQASSSDERA
jgi:hypothetical protein